jgi:hypothetical protein
VTEGKALREIFEPKEDEVGNFDYYTTGNLVGYAAS